jgi:hypothetical protein
VGDSVNRLNKSVHINPQFAWTDWELYSGNGAVRAAEKLNTALAEAVNSGNNRDEVRQLMELAMKELDVYGANDTETHWFLKDVLDEVFGDE